MKYMKHIILSSLPIAGLFVASMSPAATGYGVIFQSTNGLFAQGAEVYWCSASGGPTQTTKLAAFACAIDTPGHIADQQLNTHIGTTQGPLTARSGDTKHFVTLGTGTCDGPSLACAVNQDATHCSSSILDPNGHAAVGAMTPGWVSNFNTGQNISALQGISIKVSTGAGTNNCSGNNPFNAPFNAFSFGT